MIRPGMMPNQYAMRAAGMRNGMVNGAAIPNAEMAKRMLVQTTDYDHLSNAQQDSSANGSHAATTTEDASTAATADAAGRW